MFFALETLNKSFNCLENVQTDKDFFEELSKLSFFLQKSIECYKLHRTLIINEKIKKMENNQEEAYLNEGESEARKDLPCPMEKPEKIETAESEKNNKKGKGIDEKVKKNEEIEKMKKDILKIKDQNSKLRWELERDVFI